MMNIELPFENLDERLRNAFDAFATSKKYEQMIIPLLKDKEYKIYLNKRQISPRTSYLKVGIKKKHRAIGYMWEHGEMVSALLTLVTVETVAMMATIYSLSPLRHASIPTCSDGKACNILYQTASTLTAVFNYHFFHGMMYNI